MKRILTIVAAAMLSATPAFSQPLSEFYPNTMNVISGFVVGGSLRSIFDSDNSYMVIGKVPGTEQIQIELTGTAPTTFGNTMQFVFEAGVASGSLNNNTILQVVELYNYRDKIYGGNFTNPWTVVDVRKMTPVDQLMFVNVPTKVFVDQSTNEIRARITWYARQKAPLFYVGVDWGCWMFQQE